MSVGVCELGRPKSVNKRNDVAVKIDAGVAWKVKLIAMVRGITMAEYLSEVVGPIADRDYQQAVAEVKEEPTPRAKRKSQQPKR